MLPAPPQPDLAPTQRGLAAAAAALGLDVLTGQRYRLLWCVDIERDLGQATPEDDPTKPVGRWGETMQRVRSALQRQTGPKADFALRVRYACPITGNALGATFVVPYQADLSVLVGYPPPAGVWRVWPVPPGRVDTFERLSDREHVGDVAAHVWWYDELPF